MFNITYTLQATNVNRGLHFSRIVSHYVYLRMRRYLDEHQCRYKIIETNEYIGGDKENTRYIDRTCVLQFESDSYYHKMVEELVSFEINALDKE